MIEFIIIFTMSFLSSLVVLPRCMPILRNKGFTNVDIYKKDKPRIPTKGGIITLFTSYMTLSCFPVISRLYNRFFDEGILYTELNTVVLTSMFVISLFAFYGILDDLVGLSHLTKFILPFCFSFSFVSILDYESLNVPFLANYDLTVTLFNSNVAYSDLFVLIIIPIYILVVSNLVNMHSGFNGLQTGLSNILLITLISVSIYDDKLDFLLLPVTLLASLLPLWYYNRYPARIFEGNVGALSIGACIGIFIVVQGYYFLGIFILLPHIFDFLLFFYLKATNQKFVKFGELGKDGEIIAPNPIKLKFMITYYFKVNEKRAVEILHLITLTFCILGFILHIKFDFT